MTLSPTVQHDQPGTRSGHSDPWAELRRYEQAKADGTAPEASFEDLLDVINPLQHIPIVSTVYRELTGDQIQGPARIVGGGLYGGVGGLVGGLVNAIAEEATGRDLGEHVMVAMGLSETPADPTTPADTVQRAQADGAGAKADQAARSAAPTPAESSSTSPAPTSGTRAEGIEAGGTQPGGIEAGGIAAKAAPTGPAAPQPSNGDIHAADDRAADDTAAQAGGGPLTGLAALQAFARDSGQAAAAAQADRAAAGRARADLHRTQQAGTAPDRAAGAGSGAGAGAEAGTRADGPAGAPTRFMPLGDRGQLTNHRMRTDPAALAAGSDPIGHRRLQGDPRSVPKPATAGSRAATAPEAPAVETPAAPAAGGDPGAAAANGDLAERMMRALQKYETMRRDD